MPTRHVILLLLSLLAVSSAVGKQVLVGGYSPVKNLNDQHLVEIANFAVGEYNSQYGAHLQYSKIVEAATQVVAGMNYKIVIAAVDSGAVKNYEAVVYDVPWRHTRSLTSFRPV